MRHARFAVLLITVATLLVPFAWSQRRGTRYAPKPAGGRGSAALNGGIDGFRSRVQALLAAAGAEKGYWGMLITDAASGAVLYELNSGRYFMPASNGKIFTTAMALATLGPDFRERTTIETTGRVDASGVLHGDLVLVGRGDANLSNRVFPFQKIPVVEGPPDQVIDELAQRVASKGIKEVDGDVVADDSYFAPTRFPSGWTVDDTVWSYGAAVSALSINDNAMTLNVIPGTSVGAPLTFDLQPWSGVYRVQNSGTTTPRGTEPELRLEREPESKVFVLSGTMPMGAPPRPLQVAVPQPADHAAGMLLLALETRGLRVTGKSHGRSVPLYPAPAGCCSGSAPTVIVEHLSVPLVQDVRLTNKLSMNLHAEIMLRVAAKEKGNAYTMDDALKFATEFRQGVGISPDDVQMTDGSGLSRNDLVTPQALVQWLSWAAKQPWAADFEASFPVAGVDGTLQTRMKGSAAEGRVHAKTGYVEHIESMSGYATTERGERVVFSIFGNNQGMRARDAMSTMDAICVAMVEELGGAAPVAPADASEAR